MVLTKQLHRRVEKIVTRALEDMSFEDFLEQFDLTPQEVFLHLFSSGFIDEDILDEFELEFE